MGDQKELEKRLGDALRRIEAAVDGLPESGAAAAAVAELEDQLAAERETNTELIERIKALKARQETHVTSLEAKLSAASDAEAAAAARAARLKETIEELRGQIARLTEANRAMVGDADLVNTSMMVELEAMRATRRADAGEIESILALLSSKTGDQAHA